MYGYGYRYNSGLVVGAGGGAPFLNTYSTQFDGIDDYVQLGENNTDLQPTGAFSLSVWVKFNGLSGIQGIWEATSNVGVFGNDGYIIWKSSSNKFQFYMRQGTSWKIASGTTTVTTGTWYHILCTWDGSATSKIFINGIEEGSQSVTSINYNVNTGINLGGYQSESITKPYQIQGNIDEASLFNSVVDIADVWDGSGQPTDLSLLPTPPIAWYRMGENGVYKSPQWLLPSNENKDKVSNYSFEFDGIDDYISVAPNPLTDFTVSFWINPSIAVGASFDGILGQGTTSPQGGILRYVAYDGTGSVGNVLVFLGSWNNLSGSITNGVWTNVVLTYDSVADELKGYNNGSLYTTISNPDFSAQTTNAHSFERIGLRNGVSGTEFNGNIDEVALWDSALTDISSIYNGGTPTTLPSGAVAHYKLGEEATFSGGVWTVPDSVGSNDGTSNAMTIEDRVGEAPNSENNAVSLNMDLVDRTTDVPT